MIDFLSPIMETKMESLFRILIEVNFLVSQILFDSFLNAIFQ